MKIPLTQGKYAIVGPRDYAHLMQWKWYYSKNRKTGYARRNSSGPNRRAIRMHRVILERMGYKDFAKSDHVNGKGLDNRRCNLRPATNPQNGWNQGVQSNNTSGYKGVYWYKPTKKWRAQIKVNKKKIYLGYFDDIEDAVNAYNKAAIKYHGEFARI